MKGFLRRIRLLALRAVVAGADRMMPKPPKPSPARRPGVASVLVVTPVGGGFARYYAEILANEGLTSVELVRAGQLDAATVAGRSVVLVGDTALDPNCVSVLASWVEGGGTLVAMRPRPELSELLGLVHLEGAVGDGYLVVDTTSAPGAGIVPSPLQIHGMADRWALTGATEVAALQETSSGDGVRWPAVTVRSVGDGGGVAAAFAYDLARSVVLTRQGNPEWSGQNRDGDLVIRSDELFFGGAVDDPRPDWVDESLIGIPQADEQQRLLVNILVLATRATRPMPRLWYLPHGHRAAVVLTGDDHGDAGTVERFERYAARSRPGGSVHDWEVIRATSYAYPVTRIPWRKLIGFVRDGFEVALHVDTRNEDWTPTELREMYDMQLRWFRNRLPFAGQPATIRTHCVAWSDYVSQVHVELERGIRLDTNYYFYPQHWVAGRGGYFTGSALPMRFADLDGEPLDVYQAVTQITDESAHELPRAIEEMLDAADGPDGFVTVVTVNAHMDIDASGVSDSVLAAAEARGVPVIAARQLLTWLDARNGSFVGNVVREDDRLRFEVAASDGAHGLEMLIPVPDGASIGAVTCDGVPVACVTEVFKGVPYGRVPARTGAYEVRCTDSIPLAITRQPAVVAAGDVVEVRWTTNLPSSSAVEVDSDTSATIVVADGRLVTDHRVRLGDVEPGDAVRVRIASSSASGEIRWPAGDHAPLEVTAPRPVVRHAGSVDFARGEHDGVVVSPGGDGELVLAPAVHAVFEGELPPVLTIDPAAAATVGDRRLRLWHGRASISPQPGQLAVETALRFVAGGGAQRFGCGDPAHVGAAFVHDESGLAAVTWAGGTPSVHAIPGEWHSSDHRYRLDREEGFVRFWIDGSDVALRPCHLPAGAPLFLDDDGAGLDVAWVRVLPYGERGTYTSPVVDGGDGVCWGAMSWTVVHAQTTRLDVEVRAGDTPEPSDSWSPWTTVARAGADLGVARRYLQYRLTLSRSRGIRTPAVRSVELKRSR